MYLKMGVPLERIKNQFSFKFVLKLKYYLLSSMFMKINQMNHRISSLL